MFNSAPPKQTPSFSDRQWVQGSDERVDIATVDDLFLTGVFALIQEQHEELRTIRMRDQPKWA